MSEAFTFTLRFLDNGRLAPPRLPESLESVILTVRFLDNGRLALPRPLDAPPLLYRVIEEDLLTLLCQQAGYSREINVQYDTPYTHLKPTSCSTILTPIEYQRSNEYKRTREKQKGTYASS